MSKTPKDRDAGQVDGEKGSWVEGGNVGGEGRGDLVTEGGDSISPKHNICTVRVYVDKKRLDS